MRTQPHKNKPISNHLIHQQPIRFKATFSGSAVICPLVSLRTSGFHSFFNSSIYFQSTLSPFISCPHLFLDRSPPFFSSQFSIFVILYFCHNFGNISAVGAIIIVMATAVMTKIDEKTGEINLIGRAKHDDQDAASQADRYVV